MSSKIEFSEITRTTHINIPIVCGVAGTSRLKLSATKNAIHRIELHAGINSILIASTGANEQPVGRAEILHGAEMRTKMAEEADPRFDIYFGIENGIEQNEIGQWEDYAIIVATFGEQKTKIVGDSTRCVFPTDAVIATQKLPGGFEKNTVGKYMQSEGIIKRHEDPHIDLCGVSRVKILENAIFEILLKIFPKMR